jgi:hypothetical protein
MRNISPRIQQARAQVASRLAALGAGASVLIAAGFVVGLGAMPLIATGHSWIALPVLLFGLVLAMIGRTNAGQRGRSLSATFDLIVFAGVPFGFALADPGRALAASFLLFGSIALGAASLVANANCTLAETDRAACVAAFALACVFPLWFSLLAYALGIVCFAAAGARIAWMLARSAA